MNSLDMFGFGLLLRFRYWLDSGSWLAIPAYNGWPMVGKWLMTMKHETTVQIKHPQPQQRLQLQSQQQSSLPGSPWTTTASTSQTTTWAALSTNELAEQAASKQYQASKHKIDENCQSTKQSITQSTNGSVTSH